MSGAPLAAPRPARAGEVAEAWWVLRRPRWCRWRPRHRRRHDRCCRRRRRGPTPSPPRSRSCAGWSADGVPARRGRSCSRPDESGSRRSPMCASPLSGCPRHHLCRIYAICDANTRRLVRPAPRSSPLVRWIGGRGPAVGCGDDRSPGSCGCARQAAGAQAQSEPRGDRAGVHRAARARAARAAHHRPGRRCGRVGTHDAVPVLRRSRCAPRAPSPAPSGRPASRSTTDATATWQERVGAWMFSIRNQIGRYPQVLMFTASGGHQGWLIDGAELVAILEDLGDWDNDELARAHYWVAATTMGHAIIEASRPDEARTSEMYAELSHLPEDAADADGSRHPRAGPPPRRLVRDRGRSDDRRARADAPRAAPALTAASASEGSGVDLPDARARLSRSADETGCFCV